jgi:hypothetical protein
MIRRGLIVHPDNPSAAANRIETADLSPVSSQ